jgi:flavin reductase (DIM6/NTAB) family NADH-FMN oxidoreductase RutF
MIDLARQARTALKRAVLGEPDLPQQCTVGMRDPQSEVRVWLHGLGDPRDVTHSHLVACAAPIIVGIGFDGSWKPEMNEGTKLSLKFHQWDGEERLLGEIGLRFSTIVRAGGQELYLFEVRACKNHCLPKTHRWARFLHREYLLWRSNKTSDVRMSSLGSRSMGVFFICPRPVVLVSVADGDVGNMFPMNLMGSIGNGYFAFALNSSRPASSLVERSGRVALSSIPAEQASVARQLGRNHRQESVDWNLLPFQTKRSPALGIPVPGFALRVREMQIEAVRKLGSHTLFVAHVIRDETWADNLQFFMVHGLYQRVRRPEASTKGWSAS